MKRYDVWGANSTLEVAYTAYEGAIRRVGREFDVAGSVRRVKERIRRWMERLRHMKERFDRGGGDFNVAGNYSTCEGANSTYESDFD